MITRMPDQRQNSQTDPVLQLLQTVANLNERVLQLAEQRERQQTEALVYTVDQAAKALGVSRAKLYEMLHMPDFPVVEVGHRKLIPRKQLEQWLDQQCKGR
jgi:excisionase family DNA binding protein